MHRTSVLAATALRRLLVSHLAVAPHRAATPPTSRTARAHAVAPVQGTAHLECRPAAVEGGADTRSCGGGGHGEGVFYVFFI